MTSSALLTALKTQIATALAGWTVYDAPRQDPADKQVAMRYGPAEIGGFTFGKREMDEVVHVHLTISTVGGAVAAYPTILNARDSVVTALLDAAFITSLQTSGALLFDQGARPQFGEPAITKDSAQNAYWLVELIIPIKRSI